jgi:hypothetical protein
MALGSTQPLREMSTRDSYWGKDGRYLGLTTLSPSWADFLGILGSPTSWCSKGLSRAVQRQLYLHIFMYLNNANSEMSTEWEMAERKSLTEDKYCNKKAKENVKRRTIESEFLRRPKILRFFVFLFTYSFPATQ